MDVIGSSGLPRRSWFGAVGAVGAVGMSRHNQVDRARVVGRSKADKYETGSIHGRCPRTPKRWDILIPAPE